MHIRDIGYDHLPEALASTRAWLAGSALKGGEASQSR